MKVENQDLLASLKERREIFSQRGDRISFAFAALLAGVGAYVPLYESTSHANPEVAFLDWLVTQHPMVLEVIEKSVNTFYSTPWRLLSVCWNAKTALTLRSWLIRRSQSIATTATT